MILRKPYAFLIKHFKLIHLILAVLTCYSIYRTKALLDFFNEYVMNVINVSGQDLKTTFLPGFYKFIPLIIIAITIVILVVMAAKKKPYLFYVINIAIYAVLLVAILIASSTFEAMAHSLIDVRVARLTRDFIFVGFIVQFASVIIISIRAIGFDIKKFDFKQDLKDLEISEEDREEFEVQLTFDRNKTLRNIRKNIRFFKYRYQENKLLFNTSFTIIILFIAYIAYANFFAKAPIINQNAVFSGNSFSMSIENSYLTNTDYEGKIVNEDYYYLILQIKVKNNSKDEVLDTTTAKLAIGNYSYFPTTNHREKFFDFGNIYMGEKIGTTFEYKTLLYEIPKQLVNSEMFLSYINKNSYTSKEGFKSTKVKIDYIDLTGISSTVKSNKGDSVSFADTILSDYKVKITNYDIQKKYKLSYNYCINKECQDYYEYIVPSLTTNYDKAILKLEGSLDNVNVIKGVYDLYDFIEYFGKIYYIVGGKDKTYDISSNEVNILKAKQSSTYYIEIPIEIMNSDSISIMFTIRNKIYEYVLK